MNELSILSFFIVGLLGSVHCIGMCGGVVSAFSAGSARRVIPIASGITQGAVLARPAMLDEGLRVLAYNAGRLASYAAAGAIAGGIAQGARALAFMSSLQIILYWLANLMLVALGLYLMGAWRGLAHLESAGQLVWRRVQPLTRRLLPIDTAGKAFALGGLWGWVPCGMVYSVLLSAMLSGSAGNGAAIMLAFGAGTLPMLLGLGMAGARLQYLARSSRVRTAVGLLVLAFGLLGMARAAGGMMPEWLAAVCIEPAPGAFHGVLPGAWK
ncbi:sulfite exporter TauE/SafE family protein [Noviherbaspirillum sp. CPCC 100848]|uniref:Sulfite exporter TauE/SafE family protein n=1 Tax=Noviherbaspirillum album TaxID=3080276 RepID=A0ABU6J6V6_9BURK|nr:sulfite exporter TauE/SafE family protein [Noviherbaspirillum sp. CPCC 100848]MEC4719351.1 sulfite exporter TauE/SafE family protein [Noviherbaspirillum sp. CPCC 100848]